MCSFHTAGKTGTGWGNAGSLPPNQTEWRRPWAWKGWETEEGRVWGGREGVGRREARVAGWEEVGRWAKVGREGVR